MLKRPKREAGTPKHPVPRSRMTGFAHTPSWRGVQNSFTLLRF